MEMSLVNLYILLFNLSVTILGISIASIIAITQILLPLFSFNRTNRIVLDGKIFAALSLPLIAILLTSVPFIWLSNGSKDYITNGHFHFYESFSSIWYQILCVIMLFLGLGALGYWLYRQSRLLIPSVAIKSIHQSLNNTQIKEYFLWRYASPPMPPMHLNLAKIVGDVANKTEEYDEEKAKKDYQVALKKYEKMRKGQEKQDNPLLPLESYLLQSIRKGDLETMGRALHAFEDIIAEHTQEDSDYAKYILKYYLTVVSNSIDLAYSLGMKSFPIELLESSKRVVDTFVDKRTFYPVNDIIDFWQSQADDLQGRQSSAYRTILMNLGQTGEDILRDKENDTKDAEGVLDNIFRALGWLGERLLAKGVPEQKPTMLSHRQTEFDALMNAVTGIGWRYCSTERADEYPLIFFDCLYVIAKPLVKIFATDREAHDSLADSIFSLMYEHESFVRIASPAHNVNAVGLAIIRLRDHVRLANEAKLNTQTVNALESTLNIGALAATYNIHNDKAFFSHKTIQDEALETLERYAEGHDLSHAAHEIIIKIDYHVNYKEVKAFLVKAGDILGTTFGLNLKVDE